MSCSEGPRINRVKASSNVEPKEDGNSKLEGKLSPGLLEETSRKVEIKEQSVGREDLSYNHCKELLWKSTPPVKNCGSVLSDDQKSSSASFSSSRASLDPPHSDSNKLQTSPSQGLQTLLSLLPLLKQDTERRSAKSKVSESLPLKESKSNWNSKPEIQSSALLPGDSNPGQADLMVINGNMCNNESKTHGQELTGPETKKNHKYTKQNWKQQTQREQYQMWKQAVPEWLQPPSGRQLLPEMSAFYGLPPQAKMEDYAAATPTAFPHTCSLCSNQCASIKDWIFHQNTSFHLENCKLLRKQYPNWDCTVPLFESFPDKDAWQSASSSAQTFQHYDHGIRPESRSRSRSNSPYSCSRLEARWERSRSSSRSPSPCSYEARKRRSKSGESENSNTYRSQRRSLSPWYDSPSTARQHLRLRSHKRQSSRRSKKKRSSSHRSHKRRSSTTTRSSDQRLRSSKVEKLTERLLKTSAVQSLVTKPKLKAVIETLVPVILAELRNLKSSSAASSSSSSHAAKRSLDAKLSKVKPDLQVNESGSCRKPQAGKSSPVTTVKLRGTFDSLSDSDVLAAVEIFGNIKSVLLLKSKRKAIVCFENKKDAEKVKRMKILDIQGTSVTVVKGKNMLLMKRKQKMAPRPISVEPSVFKRQPTEPSSRAKMVLPPTRKHASSLRVKRMATRKLVSKTRVLLSKAKNVLNQQVVRPLKTGAGKFVKVKKRASKLPGSTKFTFATKTADAGDSEQKTQPETTQIETKESPKALKEATMEETRQKLKAHLQEDGDVNKEEMVENIEDAMKSLHAVSEYNQDAAMTEKLDMQLQESVLVADDVAADSFETTAETKQQAGLNEVNHQTKEYESLKYLETRAADDVKVKTITEVKLQRTKPVKSYASNSIIFTSKPAYPSQTQLNLLKTPTPSTGSSSLGQEKGPTSTVRTETDALGPQKAGRSPALKMPRSLGRVKTKTKKKVGTKKNRSRTAPATKTKASAAASTLTIEEMLEKFLCEDRIGCLSKKTVMSSKLFSLNAKVLLITNLPKYFDGCYREDEVADLLLPFGFIYKGNNIYVIPQKCMAFALMPHVKAVRSIIAYSDQNRIVFKGSELSVRVVHNMVSVTPFGFYSFLIKRIRSKLKDDGESSVFIHNVSPSEARALREALNAVGSVRRYLPLLNKVFVEFKSRREADLLGVWYSLLKRSPAHNVFRMKIPQSSRVSPPLRALPDSSEAVDGAVVPTAKCGVPQGSTPPFWITMTANPSVFPTFSPWFNIPDYLTVDTVKVIEKTECPASEFCTIMLTGLPERNYTHEDVAKLVWRYFPKQNLQTLFYNVTVLPLQRRAFVFFSNWDACCDFVLNHIRNPVSVNGCRLSVHFVVEDMQPGFSEEPMYRTMMKWSNARVSELESLEERLLCVEISEPTVHLVMMVMKEVASVAAFVDFLPLANRIVIEMAEPQGVTEAVQKISLDSSSVHQIWRKVKRIESLKSLNERLRNSSETLINLEVDEMDVDATSSAGASMETLQLDREGGRPTESVAASSLESQRKTEKLSEKEPSPKRRKLELSNQAQSLETDLKDATLRDVEEHTGDERSPSSEEEIPNALHERMHEDEKSQTPPAEKDQILHQATPTNLVSEADIKPTGDVYQVMDSVEDQPPTERELETNEENRTNKSISTTLKGDEPTRIPKMEATEEMVVEHHPEGHEEATEIPSSSGPKSARRRLNLTGVLQHCSMRQEALSNTNARSTGGRGTKEARKPEMLTFKSSSGRDQRGEKTPLKERKVDHVIDVKIKTSYRKAEEHTEMTKGGQHVTEEESRPGRKNIDEDVATSKDERPSPTSNNCTRKSSMSSQNVLRRLDGVKEEEEDDLNDASEEEEPAAEVEEDSSCKLENTWNENEKIDVNLCEVGEDETEEEQLIEGPRWDGWEVTEGRLQELLALDETEEEENGHEVCYLSQESPPVDSTNPETSGSAEGSKTSSEHNSVISKRSRRLVGPTAKRFRFHSSLASVDLKPFPLSCRPPLGEEFVEPRLGLFCSVCSVFFLNEATAEDSHCCGRAHYDNLKNYYQKLSGTSALTSPTRV
ncbi:uncharacterized protein LOC124880122 isoform X2 [Girardinichthys multiradiatus]|uniref:uncharacterized protein LOC124880122 isoform X2 n=1 Tax=Girardinichthys multiradiatus TaxID=208333 RepID=UPI001FAD065A|nr:uncharacterized protein LOC124880122 isoform X2 [Girardinichthys multiradiatus]